MTNKTLSYSLRNCDTTKGIIVREEDNLKAILLTKRIKYPVFSSFGKKSGSNNFECLILTYKNQKVGMVVHYPHSDIHLFMFEKYRNKGYMSQIISGGFLKQLWPDISTCRIVNHEEYDKVKHLLAIAGFSVCQESEEEHERYLRNKRAFI